MGDCIEREKVLDLLERYDKDTAIREIKRLPAANVRSERHGHWIRRTGAFDKRDNFYHCSECRRTINIICGDKLSNYPYCHCGTKMDEEDGEKNE